MSTTRSSSCETEAHSLDEIFYAIIMVHVVINERVFVKQKLIDTQDKVLATIELYAEERMTEPFEYLAYLVGMIVERVVSKVDSDGDVLYCWLPTEDMTVTVQQTGCLWQNIDACRIRGGGYNTNVVTEDKMGLLSIAFTAI